jgi:hypothetical protein
MANKRTKLLVILIGACSIGAFFPAASMAQQRYTPSRPTVSPYLNLFQNNRNGGSFNRALPNYYTLVRPQLEQNRVNQYQQQLLQQQTSTISQLQSNLQILQQQQSGQNVVTGHNSWFGNTGGYFANVGASAPGSRGRAAPSHRR